MEGDTLSTSRRDGARAGLCRSVASLRQASTGVAGRRLHVTPVAGAPLVLNTQHPELDHIERTHVPRIRKRRDPPALDRVTLESC